MIRFTTPDLIGLGLSEQDLIRLKKGDAVLVRGHTIDKNDDILICYGRDEVDIYKMLKDKGVIDEKTEIRI